MNKLALGVILVLAVSHSYSETRAESRAVMSADPNCTAEETASLSINFSGMRASAKEVRAAFDERLEKIESYAKEMGITDLQLQNQSYNIHTQNNGSGIDGFQYSGSATYMVKPADKGANLLELLTKHNIQTSLNVTMYRKGKCHAE